jgi:hypothetical protein
MRRYAAPAIVTLQRLRVVALGDGAGEGRTMARTVCFGRYGIRAKHECPGQAALQDVWKIGRISEYRLQHTTNHVKLLPKGFEVVKFVATTRRWYDRGNPRDAGEGYACQSPFRKGSRNRCSPFFKRNSFPPYRNKVGTKRQPSGWPRRLARQFGFAELLQAEFTSAVKK